MPKTKFGKWSVGCFALLVVLVAFNITIASFGQEGGETFFDNLLISIPAAFALLSGLGAFAFGLYSIIKQKERAVLVYIATVVGLLLIVFVVGDLLGNE